MNNLKKMALAVIASTALLTSVSTSAVELKQAFCSQSRGDIAVKVFGDGSNTNVSVSVRSGYNYVYYDKKPISGVSTVYFNDRVGKLSSSFAQMSIWSDDGTLSETINCE